LDLLQHTKFREYISTDEHAKEVHRMQYYHWQYLRNPASTAADELMALNPEAEK
jgi:mediator of RNA polymerase II transcription subunit 31